MTSDDDSFEEDELETPEQEASITVASEPESPSHVDQHAEDEDAEEVGDMRLGKYFRLYRALARPPDKRTPRDLVEIFQAVQTIQDPFILKLEEAVKKAICQRLTLEEVNTGDMIFEYGDPGDKLYLIWSGRVQIEVPRNHEAVDGRGPPDLVKFACFDPGKAFGELALMSGDNKRHARITAVKPSQLLTLTVEDYRWCVGFSQESFVKERVTFLRAADRAMLEEVPEVELQAMAAHLREEHYMGEQVILKQGAEVDRVIFVKNGFCKVVRQLHPKFREHFDLYAERGGPPPNPFATGAKEAKDAKETFRSGKGVGQLGDKSELPGLGGRQALRKLLQQHVALDDTVGNASTNGSGSRERTVSSPQRKTVASPSRAKGRADNDGGGAVSSTAPIPRGRATHGPTDTLLPVDGSSSSEMVIVDLLQAGRSFGVMEMMEGLTYQCSVVANPWAEVYVITKYDLIRNTSKVILHKLFCDYKTRLSDERLLQRMKQKSRWNNYKRDLLDDIRNRKNGTNTATIDRRGSGPRRAGVGDLTAEDYERVGNGEKLWDKRAQTPPKPAYVRGGKGGAASGALAVGTRVQIIGVKKHLDMNGLSGVIVDGRQEEGKWQVRIDNNRGDKLFKARHLEEVTEEIQHIFRVSCVRDKDGKPDVRVESEHRDASMAALDEKILMTIATARFRDKFRRKADCGGSATATALGSSGGFNATAGVMPPFPSQDTVDDSSHFAEGALANDSSPGIPSPVASDDTRSVKLSEDKNPKGTAGVRSPTGTPPSPRKAGARRTPLAKKHPVLRVQELEERAKSAAAEYLSERSGHIEKLRQAAQERTARAASGAGRRQSSNRRGSSGSPSRSSAKASSPSRSSVKASSPNRRTSGAPEAGGKAILKKQGMSPGRASKNGRSVKGLGKSTIVEDGLPSLEAACPTEVLSARESAQAMRSSVVRGSMSARP